MGDPIRVLLVEDSADDADLTLRELHRGGYEPLSERVETPEEMTAALKRGPWDVVVSDYSMPRFDAPSALALLTGTGNDIPFIVVSGSIGEDVAVTTMKAGAHDYILKQNLTRLVPAVRREIREAANRRQQAVTARAKKLLEDERDVLLERLKQENEDLAALTRVTENAISTLELEELLHVLLGRVVEVMNADTATILLAKGVELRVRASVGVVNLSDSTHVKHVGQCFAGSVAQRLKPVYVQDAAVDPLVTDPLIRERGIRSMLGVPLKRNGLLIGVLHVDWLKVRPCRDRDVRLLEITADRCGAAIQNAQLYEEAKLITAALTASEARLRQLSSAIEQTADAVLITDCDGTIEYANAAFEEITGYSPKEAVGCSPSFLKSGEHRPEFFAALWRTITAGEAFRAVFVNRHKTGALVYEETTITPIRNEEGAITHFVSTSKDVTAERRRSDELRASEERFRQLAETIDEVFWMRDPVKNEMIYISPAYETVWGRSCASLRASPKTWQDAIHPDDRERVARAALDDQTSGSYDTEYRIVRPDGAIRWIHDRAFPVRDKEGEVHRIVGVANDITARKDAEQAKRISDDRFKAIFQAEPECVKVLAADGSLLEMNAAGLAMLEVGSVDEVNARTLVQFVRPEYREAFVELHRRAIAGEAGTLEFEITGLDGSRRWLDTHAAPLPGPDGRVEMMLGVARDITDRRAAEEGLRSSLREKEALLKEVHHRVKNNLQVISSLLRLETSRSSATEVKTVLRDMQGRILAMALLHETLYRSGSYASVDLGTYLKVLATQSLRTLNLSSGSVELDMVLEPVRVEIDQAIPCGLLLNELISNCLKHGLAGGRAGTIRVELQAAEGGRGVRLRVSDTGVGLPQDFESRRASSLGLQLVSDLAKQLGGQLETGPWPSALFEVTFPSGETKGVTP